MVILRSSLPIKCALSEIIEHGTTKPATQVDSLPYNLTFLMDEFPSKSGVHSRDGLSNQTLGARLVNKMSGGHINDPFGSTRYSSRALKLDPCVAYRTTKQKHRQVCHDWHRGPRTPSRTTDTTLDCAFVKFTF